MGAPSFVVFEGRERETCAPVVRSRRRIAVKSSRNSRHNGANGIVIRPCKKTQGRGTPRSRLEGREALEGWAPAHSAHLPLGIRSSRLHGVEIVILYVSAER